jgi:hypothetical protein
MENQKSFNAIIQELRTRKKWEIDSQEKFDKATCKCCKRVLSNVGRSNMVGICSGCIHDAMNPSSD